MAQLNVKLDPQRLEALRKYATRRRTPVAWLIKDYIDYLLAGGTPVQLAEGLSSQDLATIAQRGGGFDWLTDEPDLYTTEDGEAV